VNTPRTRSRNRGVHPIGTPKGLSSNTGPIASAAWLTARDLYPKEPRWHAVIALESLPGTTLAIEIFAEEWGFRFTHDAKESWIRVTDVPFVHGRDEHELITQIPPLRDFGTLVRSLEQRFGVRFLRRRAAIRTSIAHSDRAIRRWVESL
jgi:hypothetical protein